MRDDGLRSDGVRGEDVWGEGVRGEGVTGKEVRGAEWHRGRRWRAFPAVIGHRQPASVVVVIK